MKRTYRFAQPSGHVTCTLEDGDRVRLPVFAGILRHLREDELAELLADPIVARKYTRRALEIAAWPIVREFPRAWLRRCLEGMELRPGRRRALLYMLHEPDRSPAR